MTLFITLLIIAALAVGAIALTLAKLLHICQPNEVLVFSGGKSRHGARHVPYKPIKGGRKIRIPLFEVVDRLDLTNMAINVSVHGAFSKGGIPLNVDGVANVKIAGEEPLLGNAVERLLKKRRDEIIDIAKETLEGNLRGVLATLTPEEVNADKLAFAQRLMDEADQDMNRLGLVLDTLKIQNVSDGVGYLDSIGRISSAEVRKKAIIVEAEAQADATEKDARNVEHTEVVQIDATIRTMEAEADQRVADAKTRQGALVAESEGEIGAAVVEAQAEVAVQRARIEQAREQLEADIVAPALARLQAATDRARGNASEILEQGKATASVLTQLTAVWRRAGEHAREIFLMQKLGGMVEMLAKTVEAVKIDKVTVLGTGTDGASGAGALAPRLLAASEQLKSATGVDLLGALQQRVAPSRTNGARRRPSAAPPLPPRKA